MNDIVEYSYSRLDNRGTCCNQNKETKCGRDKVPGHIYCNSCRVATGGFNRYNPPRQSQTHGDLHGTSR
jgi:hypothetical protein